jgi:phage shock protein PspC (stress-responsive transcriptional regulator)
MDKTVNINLGGSLFQVDEEAFIILRDYIQAINSRFRNVPDGTETIEDIESRIAEIFRSQKGIAGIITKENVSQMISILGNPEDFDAGIYPEDVKNEKQHSKRLYRSSEESVLGGVCGGLGAYLNTDPVLFRILFVLFAFFGGAGVLIYLVFWIAVPKAYTDTQKRELYGSSYYSRQDKTAPFNQQESGLNEVISSIGKVFYIILRIFMAAFGITILITGFLLLLAFIMIFILKIPGAFTIDAPDFNLAYVPEMMRYIFTGSSGMWIWALTIIVLLMPMIAMVYWGLKMILWFRVKDGIFNLSALIIWVLALAALSILVFDQGVSFAERSWVTQRNILDSKPDTLFLTSRNQIEDLVFDKEFSTPDSENRYSVFFSDSSLYIKPRLYINIVDDETGFIEVKKGSSGRNRRNATENADAIEYYYSINKDSVSLDEYFMNPAGKKWSADIVNVVVSLPENTILYFDEGTADLLENRIRIRKGSENRRIRVDHNRDELADRYWELTDRGLREIQ